MKSLTLFFIVLLFASSSYAVSEKILETLPKYSICKNRKIVRMVRVQAGSNENCLTVYSKGGVEKVVGDAVNDSSCLKFYNNIKSNLKDAGWTCKEVEKDLVDIAH